MLNALELKCTYYLLNKSILLHSLSLCLSLSLSLSSTSFTCLQRSIYITKASSDAAEKGMKKMQINTFLMLIWFQVSNIKVHYLSLFVFFHFVFPVRVYYCKLTFIRSDFISLFTYDKLVCDD